MTFLGVSTVPNPKNILRRGIAVLNPLMWAHGFFFLRGLSGLSSGGHFASGKYVKWNRWSHNLELHFRYELGLVRYYLGGHSLPHEVFMRTVLGPAKDSRCPGFRNDPMETFRDLRYDLANYGTDFLRGNREAFRSCVERAIAARKLGPFERFDQRWPSSITEVR
jgi:hypothetical protein